MATENKTAVTQLFDIIKGVAQYSDDNPLLNQILMSEKRLLEIEKQQMIDFADNYVDNCVIPNENMTIPTRMDVPTYFLKTYGENNHDTNN